MIAPHARHQRRACAWPRRAPSVGGGPARRRPPGARSAVSTAVQEITPGRARTACSQALRIGSRLRRLGRVDLDREADIAALDHDAGDHAEAHDVVIRGADGGSRRSAAQHLLAGRLVHG